MWALRACEPQVLIIATIGFSLLASLCFFMPLLATIGPAGDQGGLDVCFGKKGVEGQGGRARPRESDLGAQRGSSDRFGSSQLSYERKAPPIPAPRPSYDMNGSLKSPNGGPDGHGRRTASSPSVANPAFASEQQRQQPANRTAQVNSLSASPGARLASPGMSPSYVIVGAAPPDADHKVSSLPMQP